MEKVVVYVFPLDFEVYKKIKELMPDAAICQGLGMSLEEVQDSIRILQERLGVSTRLHVFRSDITVKPILM